MEKYEATENRPKRRSRVGIVFLVLLLILAGVAGYLYYSVCKAPLALDDPQKLAASEPMPAGERFRFSAADRTVQIKMDKADIWSLILAKAGDDFLDKINAELASYGLSVSGCAIGIDEEGIRLDLELYYKETRLVAKVPCTLETDGRKVSLIPNGIKLGAVSLPVEELLSSFNLEYELILPVITAVEQIDVEQDVIVLTGPMEQDIHTLVPVDEKLDWAAVFCATQQPLVEYLMARTDLTALLSHLEQNPADVEKLYHGLFVLADPRVAEEYMDSRHGMTQRFLPGANFPAATEEQLALIRQESILTAGLEQLLTELVNYYNDKAFRLSNGEFLLNRKPFRIAEYGAVKFATLFETLDPESFFLILVDAENGYIRKTSSFYRMADQKQQFTREVDFNKTYILGCVFRSVDGDPFVMYEEEVEEGNTYYRNIVVRSITEEDVSTLQEPGKFGVWTNRS